MGKRGPKKTPTIKLKHRGSWRAETRKDEPVYEMVPADLRPPKELKRYGKRIWHKVLPVLAGQCVLTQADIAAFTRYCFYWQMWQAILNDPLFSMTDLSRIESMILKLECQFGLTPASRPNIKLKKQNDNSSKTKTNYFKLG